MHILLLLSLFTINCFAQEVALWNNPEELDINRTDLLFNTEFLGNYSKVAKKLEAEEGFKRVTFTSSDGIQLSGLFRPCVNAPFSVVCCAGFLPGRKEGLASFIRLFPKNVNILFFDARGHGDSYGKFWRNLHRYGLSEYNDVAAAINYIKSNSAHATPIFLHGLCAGAYHATNTLITLPPDDQIKGLIFDSGFTNPLNSMAIPGEYCKQKIIPGKCAWLYNEHKDKAKTRYLSIIMGALAAGFFRVLGFCIYPFLKPQTEQLDLFAKLKAMKRSFDYPILFIHAESDQFAKVAPIKELANQLETDPENCWWIPDAKNEGDPRPEHALNQIKCKHEYIKRLKHFIEKYI
jgi:pimeloyl-ACP methyl ester carboxylesterase